MGDQFLQAVFDHILGRDVVKKLMQVMIFSWEFMNTVLKFCINIFLSCFIILAYCKSTGFYGLFSLKGSYLTAHKSFITKEK